MRFFFSGDSQGSGGGCYCNLIDAPNQQVANRLWPIGSWAAAPAAGTRITAAMIGCLRAAEAVGVMVQRWSKIVWVLDKIQIVCPRPRVG